MATVVQIQDWRLSIARNGDSEWSAGEILLKYPAGLVQPFSRQELARLKKRFVQLIPAKDASRDLRLPLAVLLQMPELRAQPAFVTTLAVFSVKQPLELKRRVLFDIYDQGNKGHCAKAWRFT
ncbi:hypothetical protein PC122_g24237 [Phytophthora cactorum]|nr:hypothetical protein PC122_g24237 [Phytophthora cactorum]